jgi:hypothetical protein
MLLHHPDTNLEEEVEEEEEDTPEEDLDTEILLLIPYIV